MLRVVDANSDAYKSGGTACDVASAVAGSTGLVRGGLRALLGTIRTRGAAEGASGLGDLSLAEVRQIQGVVHEAGRPLEVVGSAARGARRGIGSDLPIGKGLGTRSDIDYLIPHGSLPYYDGLDGGLPSLDQRGVIPGIHNPLIGPAIRFEPGIDPYLVPGAE